MPSHQTMARPTLKTIAQETGLAVATVSRALKDAPDIGAATRERVRAAADRLGYRPDRAGVRLRTGRSQVLALVLAAPDEAMDHTARLIRAIARALRGTSWHLIILPRFADEDPLAPLRYIAQTGSADGVILNEIATRDPRLDFLRDHGIPFVTHGRSDGAAHPFFDFDNAAFARLSVAALVARGRRRLMLLPPPGDQSYARHMAGGFAAECARLGVAGRISNQAAGLGMDGIETLVTQAMRAEDRPDGIVTGSVGTAMAAVAGIETVGLTLGDKVDLAAKEAMPLLRRFRRQILITREDVDLAGDFLARALIAAIERPAAPPLQGLETPVSVEIPA